MNERGQYGNRPAVNSEFDPGMESNPPLLPDDWDSQEMRARRAEWTAQRRCQDAKDAEEHDRHKTADAKMNSDTWASLTVVALLGVCIVRLRKVP